MFGRRYSNGVEKYYQLYLRLRGRNDCMAMGIAECTKDDVDHTRVLGAVDADMPSNGTMNADKQTPFALIQWR